MWIFLEAGQIHTHTRTHIAKPREEVEKELSIRIFSICQLTLVLAVKSCIVFVTFHMMRYTRGKEGGAEEGVPVGVCFSVKRSLIEFACRTDKIFALTWSKQCGQQTCGFHCQKIKRKNAKKYVKNAVWDPLLNASQFIEINCWIYRICLRFVPQCVKLSYPLQIDIHWRSVAYRRLWITRWDEYIARSFV